jgi:hypothetical protein
VESLLTVVVRILRAEKRNSRGTAHGHGRKEVVIQNTLVDEVLVDPGQELVLDRALILVVGDLMSEVAAVVHSRIRTMLGFPEVTLWAAATPARVATVIRVTARIFWGIAGIVASC